MYAKLLTEGIYFLETLAWSKAILFTLPFPYNKDILPNIFGPEDYWEFIFFQRKWSECYKDNVTGWPIIPALYAVISYMNRMGKKYRDTLYLSTIITKLFESSTNILSQKKLTIRHIIAPLQAFYIVVRRKVLAVAPK